MIKFIYFDFFGVLSTFVYMKVIQEYIPESEHVSWFKKLDSLDLGDITEEEFSKQIAERSKTSEVEVQRSVDAAPQVNQLLIQYIKTKLAGNYKLGLLTNIRRSLIERIIPGELSLFDVKIISSDVKLIKPDPKIFALAIERSGCKASEILFTDDNPNNIDVAKSLGMNGIVYKSFDQFVGELGGYIKI